MTSLSVGSRQRVQIARMFARERPLKLLDEPDENLDSAAQRSFIELVRGTRRINSLAIVSHQDGLVSAADEIFTFE
jgi:ABC-type lipoprotein export system ATPase subunit